MLLLCCCCSNNTISTTLLPVPETQQDKVAAVAESNRAASSATSIKRLISPVTLTASLLYLKRYRRCFSSSTRNECSHCEQQRHQVHSLQTESDDQGNNFSGMSENTRQCEEEEDTLKVFATRCRSRKHPLSSVITIRSGLEGINNTDHQSEFCIWSTADSCPHLDG